MVCEFIGNVNLFDGELIAEEPDHAVIACPDLPRPIYIGHGIASREENKRVTFALRPEKLLLCAEKPEDLEYEDYNWSTAIVHDIAYLGGHSVYYVELPSGKIAQAFMANSERNVKRPTWDDEVFVHWVDDSGVVFQQ